VTRILSGIAKWMLRQGLLLLLILAVLLVAASLRGEWKSMRELARERAILIAQKDVLASELDKLNRKAAERSGLVQQNVQSSLHRKRAELQELRDGHFWARNIPLSGVWQEIKLLENEIAFYQRLLDEERQLESAAKTLVALRQRELERTAAQIAHREEALAKSPVTHIESAIRSEMPAALIVLAAILFSPIVLRLFFYFVVAPWAANRAPIRLLPSATGRVGTPHRDGATPGDRRASAVSMPVVLSDNQELLIRPEYLQSTALQARKSTKWLFNPRIPLSSILSGMFMLTRVGPAGAEPVVISATRDALGEVGIVDLASDAAFVCQPRALVGVIQDREKPVRITQHWRLGSLQAWLTLQLRFLVFHGPGQLVMKGCRGIRIEQVGTGRLINQAATLGFSANAAYANTRCETFVSYWSGQEDLFNDLFAGESGVYVYEEMPDRKRATGIGRHLEGFTDAILKAFGI
jgi:hypothetical protein